MSVKKVLRYFVLVIMYIVLVIGVIAGYIVITSGGNLIFGVLDIIISSAACVSFIIYPVIIIMAVALHDRNKKFWTIAVIIGLVATVMNAMPLIAGINSPITSAEQQFKASFGNDYMSLIPSEMQSKMRTSPFEFWRMYTNLEQLEYNVNYTCGPYLVDPISNDEFYFDYYSPVSGSGPFPVLINIHGGAWVIGNKGLENLVFYSRYFASQGYVVFDIQYGLAHFPGESLFGQDVDTLLSNVQGLLGRPLTNKSYTVAEMIVHVVGNFTDYLAAHASEYKANISSVFVTGLSAGGHLTNCFIGWNTTWRHVFNNSVKIRGIIPRYGPADLGDLYATHINDLILGSDPNFADLMEKAFGGNPATDNSLNRLISPIYYVNESAPACLFLQGSQDALAPASEARALKVVYDTYATNPCILIEFPYVGHMFDIVPTSPAGQIALYYWERFMAIMQNWGG
ncbi:MAG: alpha/beta hydrolase fold domain-containing protein [Candidatus Helarchaeota archaeon]